MTLGGSFGGMMPQEYQDEVSNKYAGRYGSFQLGHLQRRRLHRASEKTPTRCPCCASACAPCPTSPPASSSAYSALDGKGNVADTYWTKTGPFKGKELYPDFKVFDGALSYQHKYFTLQGEYYEGRGNAAGTAYYKDTDYVAGKVDQGLIFQARYQRGYSFFGQIRFPEERKWAIIGRMDYFDPDTKGVLLQNNSPYTNRDVQRRYITGVAYYLFKDNIILFDYDVLQHSQYFLNKTKANPNGYDRADPRRGPLPDHAAVQVLRQLTSTRLQRAELRLRPHCFQGLHLCSGRPSETALSRKQPRPSGRFPFLRSFG